MREEFVEKVLKALAAESAKKAGVDSIDQLVEVENGKFQALFFFQEAGVFGVVRCRGTVELFKDIRCILRFKDELRMQIEKQLQTSCEPVAVFETSLCLN